MWARVCEFMIGCWMLVSPFIFHHGADARLYWITDLACSVLITFLAAISCWKSMRHAHLAIILVAAALVVIGRFGSSDSIHVPPAGQNEIAVGFLLMMFAIIPNHASRPPKHIPQTTETTVHV